MKRILAIVLAAGMVFAMTACGAAPAAAEAPKAPEAAPAVTEAPQPTEGPTPDASVSFLWDNFDDRDPATKPELSPNCAQIRWDSWEKMRGRNENGAVRLNMLPAEYDVKAYESEEDYYAHAEEWMADWGEAVNMWSLEGISWCRYMVIRMKGNAGGEENMLILDWHPEDARFYAALFADLVLADGRHPVISTEWQTFVIDLEASGFPGMTDALHLRAFLPCMIWVDEISFAEPVAPVDTASRETILAGITMPETGRPGDLPVKEYVDKLSLCMLGTLGF